MSIAAGVVMGAAVTLVAQGVRKLKSLSGIDPVRKSGAEHPSRQAAERIGRNLGRKARIAKQRLRQKLLGNV